MNSLLSVGPERSACPRPASTPTSWPSSWLSPSIRTRMKASRTSSSSYEFKPPYSLPLLYPAPNQRHAIIIKSYPLSAYRRRPLICLSTHRTDHDNHHIISHTPYFDPCLYHSSYLHFPFLIVFFFCSFVFSLAFMPSFFSAFC